MWGFLMSKLYEILIIIHLVGWGVSSIYFEWEYKNNHSAVNSYFLSDYAGVIKGFFWEYNLLKGLKEEDSSVNSNRLLKRIDMKNNIYNIVSRDDFISVDIIKNEKFLISADDTNNDVILDKCISEVYDECPFDMVQDASEGLLDEILKKYG